MSMREQGTGSIRWRDDRQRWEARLTIGYLPSGNPRRITKLFATKNEALRWIAAQQAARDSGTLVVPSRQLLRQWASSWLASKARSPSTYAGYRYVLESLILPELGDVPLAELTPFAIQVWVSSLEANKVPSQQVHRAWRHLRMCLGAAVKLELMGRNPADRVKVPPPRPIAKNRWSAAEVSRVLHYAQTQQHPLRYYLHIALATGLRREELLGLRWDDVGSDYVDVAQAIVYIRGSANVVPPKTGPRRVYIDPATRCAFDGQRALVDGMKLHLKGLWKDHRLCFPSSHGTPASESNLSRQWKELCDSAKVTRIKLSDTRATWVSLTEGLAPELWLARRAGHSVEVRRKHYSRTLEDELRSIAFSLDELISGKPGGGRAGGRVGRKGRKNTTVG